VAGDGRIYVTDAMQGLILYDMKKKEVQPIGENVTVELKDPRGVAYGHGKVYVGVVSLGQVVIIDDQGNYAGRIGRQDQFKNPVDVVVDTIRSRVYVVDNHLHTVFVYSEAGDSLFTIGRRGSKEGDFNYPQSAAVDRQGNLYVVDAFNFRIEVFDTTGKFLRMFGKQGDAYGTFARPKGIALDNDGNIYVLDGLHNNFQIFNNAGELLMFVGRFSPNNDGFQDPVSIAIDARNMIYVTDNLNSRIQMFQLLQTESPK
jgi:DNA-binding beta-propeller fold protein YncE